MNSPRSLTNAAIRLVKIDRLQKPVQAYYFTSREPSVGFVQGALSINSDLSFELKLEQNIAVNCLLEGRDVFAAMTGFGKRFFSAVLHSDRTEEDSRRVPERCDSSYLPVDRSN